MNKTLKIIIKYPGRYAQGKKILLNNRIIIMQRD